MILKVQRDAGVGAPLFTAIIDFCCYRMSTNFLLHDMFIAKNGSVYFNTEDSFLLIEFCPFCGAEIKEELIDE